MNSLLEAFSDQSHDTRLWMRLELSELFAAMSFLTVCLIFVMVKGEHTNCCHSSSL